jgi:hypothetical protein
MSELKYNLALVEDRGAFWQVLNISKSTTQAMMADALERMLPCSSSAGTKIQNALEAGHAVRISKTLCTDEVQPWEVTVIASNNIDDLQSVKDAALVKVRMLVNPELAKLSGLTLYGFMVLNNDLISAGYTITNTNREEQYLKILETGNEQLIAKLEDYLNYKDDIERVASVERAFAAFKKAMRDCTTAEAVAELEQRYITNFFAHE